MLKAANCVGALLATAAAVSLPLEPASAQQVAPAAKSAKAARAGAPEGAAQKADPAAAQRLLDSGLKAYEAGRVEQAIQSLSAALRGGGLPSQQMAKALYVRGLAYRKQGKPAQAISDLTSAVWLKGGLGDTERADAMSNRAAAYREAGLGEAAPIPASAGGAAQLAPAASPSPGWNTSAKPAATARAEAAAPPASSFAPDASAAPAEAQAAAPATAGGGAGLGGFFSGLFGGQANAGSASPEPRADSGETASISPPSQTSSWSEGTSVAEGRANKSTAAAATAKPVKTAAVAATSDVPKVAATGKFRLQVAAVRSREEAASVAAKLKQQHAAALRGAEPVVEETVIGNMGTFYRVRLGPYADAEQPRKLCAALKPQGYDCLLVTQ